MFSKVFLARTGREIAESPPGRIAYMALRFSPYAKGLSNLPAELPSGSVLLLDDSMPPENHSPEMVVSQLTQIVHNFSPYAVLLDFQRPVTKELKTMTSCITQALTCPVGVTKAYAKDLRCPVFLPPPPVNKALAEYCKPWLKHGVYLEIAPDCLATTVTSNGSNTVRIPSVKKLPLADKKLHCHYNVEVFSDRAVFTMCRYKEDLAALV